MCCNISCYGNPEVSMKEKIENDVKNSLPIGTSFNDVKAYLDNLKIEYSWNEKNNAFYGIVRNAKKQGIVNENIQLIIVMDDEKKLKSIEAKTVMTGL
jgi:hypothetical protein